MVGIIRNASGERLDATFTEGSAGSPDAHDSAADLVVVIGHGVTANKDREWAVTLAAELERHGMDSLRFSFSGNGRSEGRFQDSTVTKEVHDLGAVLDAIAGRRVAYVGHSMGAAVGVLRAARDARIRWLVSLGGMVDTAGFAHRKFSHLVPGRDVMWAKPECPLSQRFLDDMQVVGSVAPQAAEIRIPWLLVHGTDDDVVPPAESREIHASSSTRTELVELDGADHVFSGDAAPRMAAIVREWLERRVGAGAKD